MYSAGCGRISNINPYLYGLYISTSCTFTNVKVMNAVESKLHLHPIKSYKLMHY